jgi:uncharacterized membrane protein YjjB (DUF3815 family)
MAAIAIAVGFKTLLDALLAVGVVAIPAFVVLIFAISVFAISVFAVVLVAVVMGFLGMPVVSIDESVSESIVTRL